MKVGVVRKHTGGRINAVRELLLIVPIPSVIDTKDVEYILVSLIEFGQYIFTYLPKACRTRRRIRPYQNVKLIHQRLLKGYSPPHVGSAFVSLGARPPHIRTYN